MDQLKKNRDKLRNIMEQYRLKSKHVAQIVGVSDVTVRIYASNTGGDMPDNLLRLLELEIEHGNINNVLNR